MPSRIGSEALFRSQLSYLQRIQNRQALVDEQISTGFKSQTFSGVAADAGSIISASGMMAKIDQYNRNITIATNRMKLMDSSMSAIDKSISTLNGYLAQLSDSTTPPDVPALAKDLLNQVTDYLNLSDGERFLFSGSNVSTAPVKTLSAGGGVSPTVPAVPATLARSNSIVLPLASAGVFPASNFQAPNTYFRPDPDNPTVLQSYKADLPPLTSIELAQQPGDAAIEPGRVIQGIDGARARIVYHTASTAGVGATVRAYIEPLNEIPFRANDTITMMRLDQVGSTYTETTPEPGGTYTMIGGVSKADIDTQSVQINGPLPMSLQPGTVIEFGVSPAPTTRAIISEIQNFSNGSPSILKVRPLSGSTVADTGASRLISIVNSGNGPYPSAGVSTNVVDGREAVSPIADYRTNDPTVNGTGYYTNTQAAREILTPQKIQVTDNSTVDYGTTADKPAFARLIYTLNFLQQQTSPLSKEDVGAATRILTEARTQISSLRASSGINQKTLAGITEQNTLQKSIANKNFDDLAKQDKTEAIATLTSLQTILEASFNSFARIQDLNLQSFLR